VHHGVAYLGAIDGPVEMKEEADLALRALVENPNPPEERIAAQVDGVVEGELDLQVTVLERDVGDQRVRQVNEVARPAGIIEPGKPAIDPNAEPAGSTAGVILLADPRVIDVAQLVIAIEVDQQAPVPDRQVA